MGPQEPDGEDDFAKHGRRVTIRQIAILEIDSEITLRQLERSDAEAIFETIDQQREYLGRWLPLVAYTLDISDSQGFVDSVVNARPIGLNISLLSGSGRL